MLSVGRRESVWTRQFGKPFENKFPFKNLAQGKIDPKAYLKLLDKYLSLAPHILPEDADHHFNHPSLRHPGNRCKVLSADGWPS